MMSTMIKVVITPCQGTDGTVVAVFKKKKKKRKKKKMARFCVGGVRKQMTFVCASHQHPLAQLSIRQDVLWHKCGSMCVWPLGRGVLPVTTAE